jgi:hypothetical protein
VSRSSGRREETRACRSALAEVGQIQHEAVADVASIEAGEGLLDASGGEQFDVRGDAVLAREGP